MIKGLSDRRRPPRLGKVRLGVMVQEPGKKPYPRATDHFVCPAEVERFHGAKPKTLPIMLPHDNPAVIFPQELKMYRASGLYCAGDGERAKRWDEKGELREMKCPCPYLESGECGPVATLNFLMPDVPGVGIYQLITGNQRSIVSLNTSLDTFSKMFGGLRGIPFVLHLELEQIQRFDEKAGRMVRQTLHVLRLDSPHSIREIMEWQRKQGRDVEPTMLMPAPDPDEVERTPLPPAEEPVAEPAVTSVPMAGVTPEAGVASPPIGTLEECFARARGAGFEPDAYGTYLQAVYKCDVDNLTSDMLHDEGEAWRQAASGPAALKARRQVMAAVLRKASGGQERLL